MQLALLDRIAGTAGAAERFGARLEALRRAHAQLAAIDALGSAAQRQQLQALADQARRCPICRIFWTPLQSGFLSLLSRAHKGRRGTITMG
jgi:hypothetical protein